MSAVDQISERRAAFDHFARDARPGIWVLDGYGLRLSVSRGHLIASDGIGRTRRERRISRADRTVRRIVILGHTGTVSLEAIRWCADIGITLTQIDTDGTLLLTAGLDGKNDARLRRSQAAAPNTPVGLQITRGLLEAKIRGQATIARGTLAMDVIADRLNDLADQLATAPTIPACRELEATASGVYFAAWAQTVRCTFARDEHDKVPDHWRTFTARGSQINVGGRSARNAATPINALLNYGYTLAEAECRHAAITLGLDPGLGIVHTDRKDRDSLALDLLEPLRPLVEQDVLNLLGARHFRADDFHETRQGSCRLLPPLTHELATALPGYARAIGPIAEGVAHSLASASPGKIVLTTPLSRSNTKAAQTRRARAKNRREPGTTTAKPRNSCQQCGADLYGAARKFCPSCWSVTRNSYLSQYSRRRPSLAPSPTVEEQSGGISHEEYQTKILPGLARIPLPIIEEATGLANSSCSLIRRGLQIPNPKHWAILANLARQHTQDRYGV